MNDKMAVIAKKSVICITIAIILCVVTIPLCSALSLYYDNFLLDDSETSALLSLRMMLKNNLGIDMNLYFVNSGENDIQECADACLRDAVESADSGQKNIMYLVYYKSSNECSIALSDNFNINFSETDIEKIKKPMLNTEDILGERVRKSINVIMDIAYEKDAYDASIEDELSSSTISSAKMSNYLHYKNAIESERNRKFLYIGILSVVILALLAVIYLKAGKKRRTFKIIVGAASALVIFAASAAGYYISINTGSDLNNVKTVTVSESAEAIGKKEVYDISVKLNIEPIYNMYPDNQLNGDILEWQYFTESDQTGYYVKYINKDLADKKIKFIKDYHKIYTNHNLEEINGKNFKFLSITSATNSLEEYKYYLLIDNSLYYFSTNSSTNSKDIQIFSSILSEMGLKPTNYINT